MNCFSLRIESITNSFLQSLTEVSCRSSDRSGHVAGWCIRSEWIAAIDLGGVAPHHGWAEAGTGSVYCASANLTLYATGIRASELIHLSPYDVDTEEGVLRVIRGKGGKDRHVPLTRVAADAIAAYLMNGRPVLLARREPEAACIPRKPRSGSLSRRVAACSTTTVRLRPRHSPVTD